LSFHEAFIAAIMYTIAYGFRDTFSIAICFNQLIAEWKLFGGKVWGRIFGMGKSRNSINWTWYPISTFYTTVVYKILCHATDRAEIESIAWTKKFVGTKYNFRNKRWKLWSIYAANRFLAMDTI